MSYNNLNLGYGKKYEFTNQIDPYYCFKNRCPKMSYQLFKPRLQDDSLYPIKHSVLDQYGKSEFDYNPN